MVLEFRIRQARGNVTGKTYIDYLSLDGERKALSDGIDAWALYRGKRRLATTKDIERVKRFVIKGDWT